MIRLLSGPALSLLLLAPRPAAATITWEVNDGSSTTYEVTGDPDWMYDVFIPKDVLYVQTGPGYTCTLRDPDAASHVMTSLGSNRYRYTFSDVTPTSPDPEGLWAVECVHGGSGAHDTGDLPGGTTTGDPQFVFGAHHEKLWLDVNSPEMLAREFADTPISGSSRESHFDRDLPSATAGVRAPPYTVTEQWTRATMFERSLDRRFCGFQAVSGTTTTIPTFSGGSAQPCTLPTTKYRAPKGYAPTSGPTFIGGLNSGDNQNVRAFARQLEELTVATLVGRACQDAMLAGECTRLAAVYADTNGYEAAFEFWGRSAVEYPTTTSLWGPAWTTSPPDPNTDLARSEVLIALVAAYDLNYRDLDIAQRRAWRDKIYREASSHYTDYYVLDPDWPVLATTTTPRHTERALRNGHYVEKAAALGIAVNVLYQEMSTSALSTERDDWNDLTHDFFDDHVAVIGIHSAAASRGHRIAA